MDYIQTMEHIEREARIGQILLSKSQDAAVKVLSHDKKASNNNTNNRREKDENAHYEQESLQILTVNNNKS